MSSNPLTTVAMVTFNSERYVGEAIESVLSQSYDNLELVISDDCSADGTWDIIKRYRDPRIRAEHNSRNLGEYPNRNRVLEMARGEYLIYIDGSDILYPHGLEFMVRMLDSFPDAAMALACPWSEQFVYPALITPREFYRSQYFGRGIQAINFAHILFRRSALCAVEGLDTRFKAGDPVIQFKLGLSHPVVLINDNLAWWRRSPGQASQKVLRDGALIGWAEAIQWRREFLGHPECPLNAEEKAQAMVDLYGKFLRVVLRRFIAGRISQALFLMRVAKLPWRAWRYVLTPGRYDYLSNISAVNPLGNWRQSPFVKLVDNSR